VTYTLNDDHKVESVFANVVRLRNVDLTAPQGASDAHSSRGCPAADTRVENRVILVIDVERRTTGHTIAVFGASSSVVRGKLIEADVIVGKERCVGASKVGGVTGRREVSCKSGSLQARVVQESGGVVGSRLNVFISEELRGTRRRRRGGGDGGEVDHVSDVPRGRAFLSLG